MHKMLLSWTIVMSVLSVGGKSDTTNTLVCRKARAKRNSGTKPWISSKEYKDGCTIVWMAQKRVRVFPTVAKKPESFMEARRRFQRRFKVQNEDIILVTTGTFYDPKRGWPVGYNRLGDRKSTRKRHRVERAYFVIPASSRGEYKIVNTLGEVLLLKEPCYVVELGGRLKPFRNGGFSASWRNRKTERYAIALLGNYLVAMHGRCPIAKFRTISDDLNLTQSGWLDGGSAVAASPYRMIFYCHDRSV